jgi:hypothetical protein
MFSVAAATFGARATPELHEGGRPSASRQIRRSELDAAFLLVKCQRRRQIIVTLRIELA